MLTPAAIVNGRTVALFVIIGTTANSHQRNGFCNRKLNISTGALRSSSSRHRFFSSSFCRFDQSTFLSSHGYIHSSNPSRALTRTA
ncbi:hypothetical protein A6X21_18980 [Planctopirus hydrillae]|uniref:Uncharacterized protein n=1 Tax=Planctopirus hydrillae TaxID=1841610 RepID=A0A1C3EJH7_9PLAN|nr:hypothetical protein A6X21_18980 [Planctopirus hydrillae]